MIMIMSHATQNGLSARTLHPLSDIGLALDAGQYCVAALYF